jgi:hypothetical protein
MFLSPIAKKKRAILYIPKVFIVKESRFAIQPMEAAKHGVRFLFSIFYYEAVKLI